MKQFLAQQNRSETPAGFALIASISIMVLLVMIALGMLGLSAVEQRSSTQDSAMLAARANARMALMIAIGELQKAAGPDQRITATGDMFSDKPAAEKAQDGRAHWTGVWDTSSHDPSDPDTRTFVNWLVSSVDPTMNANVTSVATLPADDDVIIFEDETDAAGSVMVPKVPVDGAVENSQFYAYWVEDEGVKADLALNDSELTDTQREQVARLTSASGVDYAVFEGPFEDQLNYPLKKSANEDLFDNMNKALSNNDMPLVMGSSSEESEWLASIRHDASFGSRGVLADAKRGGLRRDLSLAFEMDGDADISSVSESASIPTLGGDQPTLFNQQLGEFVGDSSGDDKNSASLDTPGMPVRGRYLFRETAATDPYFSDKFSNYYPSSESVVRGPTWWALRDFHNLYKQLKGNKGNYSLEARATYPNRSELKATSGYGDNEDLSDSGEYTIAGLFHENYWNKYGIFDCENNEPGKYFYRPVKHTYAPVNLGVTMFLSVTASGDGATPGKAKLAINIEPIFYLWNPYNHNLEVEAMCVYLDSGFPGKIHIRVKDAAGQDLENERYTLEKLITKGGKDNAYNKGRWAFLIKDPSNSVITLKPGEVVAATATAVDGEFQLGYGSGFIPESGIFLDKVKTIGSGRRIQFTELSFDKVEKAAFVNVYLSRPTSDAWNVGKFKMDTNIPPANATITTIADEVSDRIGDQTQFLFAHVGCTNSIEDLDEYIEDKWLFDDDELDAFDLIGNKEYFGFFHYMMKPASWSGPDANPVEVFSRFNPAPYISYKDWNNPAVPNMVFNLRSSRDVMEDFSLGELGINPNSGTRSAFWGASCTNMNSTTSSTSVPMKAIPSAPLLSLAEFSNANFGIMASDPYHAIGNSWSSPLISPIAPHGVVNLGDGTATSTDLSWHCNNALFDHYYLSGIAPAFSIAGSGYSTNGNLEDTLTAFYGATPEEAQANPAIIAHIPKGKTKTGIVDELTPSPSNTDGYKKLAAYSLVNGAFNVNSTSVKAWESLLRSNRGLAVDYAQGGSDTGANETPYPSSHSPSEPGNGAKQGWAGLPRLSDAEITQLAQNIVSEVKARGPFMSLADFVNHKVGGNTVTEEHQVGALQAAIDKADLNADVYATAGGTKPDYDVYSAFLGNDDLDTSKLNTATGIAMDLTQADVLRPLAPRLSARSDTFRVRAYGEATIRGVTARVRCEAVVQRLPAYVDSTDDPWDENLPADPLSEENQKFGRSFQIMSFRWLSVDES